MQAEPIIALHNQHGLRLFGYRMIGDHISANDVGRYSTLLSIDRITLNSAPVTGDLLGGIAATERPLIRATFDNRNLFWSHLVGTEVLLHQIMALLLYYGGTYMFEWFRGEILSINPRTDVCTVEFGEAGPLHETLTLLTADIYPKPENRADILPIVYGDFLSDAVNSTDEDSGGATPAILIDRDNRMYLLSFSRCAADRPKVYVDDTLQADDPAVYTFYNDVDLGDGIRIAALQFHVPVSGKVSVRMKGTINPSTGALITSPIDAIQHLFTTYGSWSLNYFDVGSTHRTRAEVAGKGETIHWCFNEQHTYKEWLVEILRHHWVGHTVTSASQLAFVLNPEHVYPEKILATIDARADLAGDDPEASIDCPIDAEDLCNAGVVNYRWSWSSGKFTGTFEAESLPSLRAHRRQEHPGGFNLPGIRTEAHASAWLSQLLGRTAWLPMKPVLRLRGLRFPFLVPGSFFACIWRAGPSTVGLGWPTTAPRILGVRNMGMTVGNPYTGEPQEEVLECFDTGLHYRRTTYADMVDNNGNHWYVWVNEAGELSADPVPIGLDVLNPDAPWRYLQRVSPLGVTYYIYLMTNAAGTGLEWEWNTVSPGGVGSATDVGFVNRRYHVYVVRISDRPEIYTTRYP